MSCLCGCGQATRLATKTDRARNHVRGEPIPFVNGHQSRAQRRSVSIEDCGHDTPCWIWTGALNERGYGRAWGGPAHRVFYERHVGQVPPGLELDHLCRNRACVNPAHLEPVTHAENMRRSALALALPASPGLPAQIRAARVARGMSQVDLAQRLGTSRSLISLWESGQCQPGPRLAGLLDAYLAEGAGTVAVPAESGMETFGGRRAA